MKVAVSAMGNGLDSAVDPRFGRAAWFVVVDTDTGQAKAIDNAAAAGAGSGAGVSAAQTVVREGADYVLTGHCGPNAFRTLEAAGARVIVGVEGSVGQAVEALKAGGLTEAGGPDVGPHSGSR